MTGETGQQLAGQQQERINEAHRRLDRHDGRLGQLETDRAVSQEQYKSIVKSLDKISGTMTWMNRLIVGGIVTGIIAFIISGGLNLG